MDTKPYYETYWSDAGFKPEGRTGPLLERQLRAHVTPGRWLDVGCGDGRSAGLWLRDHGCDYVGMDISATAVEQAVALGLDARRIDNSAALPADDGEFDGVVCFEVLEHLFDPETTVGEIRRVLRPGGRALLSVPNVAYWHRRLELLVGHWDPDGDDDSAAAPWRDPHIRFFTAKALERLLLGSGFTTVRMSGLRGELLGHVPLLGRFVDSSTWLPDRLARERRPSVFAMSLLAVAEV